MHIEKCPYCRNSTFDKFVPPSGNKVFIGSADTQTRKIYVDKGFICDLYVCTNCGNVHLKLEK